MHDVCSENSIFMLMGVLKGHERLFRNEVILLRIAQVCPRYYPDIGGIETYVKEISERLVAQGYEVEVVTTDPGGKLKKYEIINGVRITRFKSFAPNNAFFFAPKMYFYLKKQNHDVIHAHNYHAFPSLFAALAKNSTRLVFNPYFHGKGHTFFRNILHVPYKLLGYYIFNQSDKIVCISKYEQKKIQKAFNIEDDDVEIIPPGIDGPEFKNIEPFQREGKTILYVGRLEAYKGVQYLIEAFLRLKEYRLVIIGEGPYEINLKSLSQKLNMGRIDWLNNVSRTDLLRHYKSANVFVLLSKYESYGITVAEALACGTPCVVALGSALDEFVDGKSCIGIEQPLTADKLIDAVIRLDYLKDKSGTRLQKIENWDHVVERLICIYKESDTNHCLHSFNGEDACASK